MIMEMHQKQTQILAMTPQMEQAIKILEMDMRMLDDYLLALSLENPVMDLDTIHHEESSELSESELCQYDDWQNLKHGLYDSNMTNHDSEKKHSPQDTLQAFLLEQALFDCPKNLYPAVVYAIGFIDENGYLTAHTTDIAAWGAFDHSEIERAVGFIQNLEPAGVGARNLSECLILQLPEEDALTRHIVSLHLEDIAKGHFVRLAKLLDISGNELANAVAEIKRLNPKPGSGFGNVNMPSYITPEIMVVCSDNLCHVQLYTPRHHTVKLNQSYTDLIHKTEDESVKAYINNKIKQLRWIQKCIDGRSQTLLNVAKAIVNHQEQFFLSDPQHMRALSMADIARSLDLHVSTVSRTVKNKYLICAHGTFPLKHFFVQGIKASSTKNSISTHDIKQKIQELIASEDKASPLSDHKITLMLERQGIQLSRRTIVKYREQLRIPSSQYRRINLPSVMFTDT